MKFAQNISKKDDEILKLGSNIETSKLDAI